MEDVLIFALMLLAVYLIGAPVFLFFYLRRLARRLFDLEQWVRAAGQATAAQSEPPSLEPDAAPADDAGVADEATEPEPEAPADVQPQPDETPVGVAAVAAAGGPWARTAKAPPAKPARSFEETIASRWMIWLGGLAVALSAVFLFRHAIDQAWLTPMTRVIAGLLLGAALLSAGEWTLHNPVGRVGVTDYVPPALTAAGIFAIYASLFAAQALYGFLTAPTGFVALGLVSYAALGLALRQGWFVAVLGLLAGYLVPLLVESPDPQAAPVFLYLFLLTAGCLALRVWRGWWWLSWLTLAGALVWPLLWIDGMRDATDQGVVGAYLLGVAALFGALSTTLPVKDPNQSFAKWLWLTVRDTSGLGFALSGVLLLILADAARFNDAAFLLVAIYGVVALALAMWRPGLEALFAIAAVAGLAVVAIWPQQYEISQPLEVARLGTGTAGTAFGPFVMPPEFAAFARALWILAALYGIGGYAGLRRVRTPGLWAGVSASMPVLLFTLGYGRIGTFEIDVQWAGLAVVLALAMLAAAYSVTRLLGRDRRDLPLALYAAGCTAALALAFACQLREAWLTVAIAAEVVALGWIWSRLAVPELRTVAVAVVLVVIVRLILNEAVFDYSGTVAGVFGWVVYGYGLPALFIAAASRLFAQEQKDILVTLCEITAFGLASIMVALQLKLWTSGDLRFDRFDLLDQSVQSVWWIVAAAMLLHRRICARYGWAQGAGLLVLLAAGVQVFLGQVIVNNPLTNPVAVGRVVVANLLGLAYLAPALLILAIAGLSRFDLPAVVRRILPGAGGILIFLYLTLETRRAFWGSVIELTPATFPRDAEVYAYSVVWLLYALSILAAGILRRSQALRYASLAVLVVTVAKVFLYDMSDLTGLFRIASFLGLGLVLIGIGRVYQKYVFGR